MPDTVVPKTQTTSPLAARFQCFSPRWSAIWAPHHCKPRPRRYQAGGIAPCKGATRRRHAARGLRMAQNPHRYQCRARCRGGRARMGHRWVVETRNCTRGRCHGETNLAQHEPHGPTSGTKLSQHTPSHRMCGTKLSLHARPRRISGIKLSLLTRNGPIWRNLRMQGEFCTVLTTKKPSRENFAPNAGQRRG